MSRRLVLVAAACGCLAACSGNSSPSTPKAVGGGTGSASKTRVAIAADLAQAVLANPSGYYFNLHTALNPNGAVRAQLASGADAPDYVPTPDY